MFFWIIVLSFLIPVAMRLYRRSARGRNQGTPGQFGRFPGNQNNPGNQSNQPRDGYTQQDYFGGFGQLGAPRQPGPVNEPYPGQQFPNQPYPGQQYPDQQYPNPPYSGPSGYQSPVPYEDSPEYLNNPPQPQRQAPATPPAPAAGQPQAPQTPHPTPQPPSGAQGYRARKLAELDQQYSDGKLSMEDYMAQRAEIMKG
ncbi:hypothetical protein ACFRJ8_10890 [Arthrobacter sp. NPDC056886]|uniref:hypothetical protein n=1 Tax=Arthrobacter sp. NPDC056886 TaxID=3345960 RepID=UPI00366AF6E2